MVSLHLHVSCGSTDLSLGITESVSRSHAARSRKMINIRALSATIVSRFHVMQPVPNSRNCKTGKLKYQPCLSNLRKKKLSRRFSPLLKIYVLTCALSSTIFLRRRRRSLHNASTFARLKELKYYWPMRRTSSAKSSTNGHQLHPPALTL